jgi:hypothetical protein
VPVLPNYSFDQAIAAVMDLVMERTTQRADEIREASAVTIQEVTAEQVSAEEVTGGTFV